MKFEIKNRWTGAVQITAEIDCEESASSCRASQLSSAPKRHTRYAIYSALGTPCGHCGGPESAHVSNYYCPEYRARKW